MLKWRFRLKFWKPRGIRKETSPQEREDASDLRLPGATPGRPDVARPVPPERPSSPPAVPAKAEAPVMAQAPDREPAVPAKPEAPVMAQAPEREPAARVAKAPFPPVNADGGPIDDGLLDAVDPDPEEEDMAGMVVPVPILTRETGPRRPPAEYACPSCGDRLERRPRSRAACPACDATIHVRSRQKIFPSGLVGESDVRAVDFLESVEPFGVTEALCRERLTDPVAAGSLGHVVWDLCEQRLKDLPAGRRPNLLNEMVHYRVSSGEDARDIQRRVPAALLDALQESGAERVRVVTRGGTACAACRELEGRVLALADARSGGLLPVEGCTHADGICRCRYTPE